MIVRRPLRRCAWGAAFVASLASAQQAGPVATITQMEGSVLVSQPDGMVTANKGERLSVGTRVVTTARSRATILYDNGCDIYLVDNERHTIRVDECAALRRDVAKLGPAPGAIGGGTGGVVTANAAAGLTTGVGVLGVIGVAAIAGYESFRNNPVSPN